MIKIGFNPICLKDFYEVLYQGKKIEITPTAIEKVRESYEFLKNFSKDKVIYGINTGLGPMAQYKINDHEQVALQYNLIRSHASGAGNKIDDVCVKALMLSRLNTLLQGYSGISVSAVELLKDFINHNIFPVIYQHGGVGASGDLVQLSHLALSLIGEGEVSFGGEIIPTSEALKRTKLKALQVSLREGLAIMNGTSAMTGIGIVNIINAKNIVQWAIAASAIINEIVETYDDHFSAELNNAKLHKGQRQVAKFMQQMLESSKLIRRREEHLYHKKVDTSVLKDKVQEYYSIRCVPQIIGPVLDTLEYACDVVINEVNSASDNPIIDLVSQNVYHGGNFHGDYVALEMDKLKIAITKLSMLCERQLNYLLNAKLNEKLPPFVNLGKLGLNFGMQGVQFTATSTVAENQTLSNPMYVHSISNNSDNQDIVSMGANAAWITQRVINNTYEVLAIELVTLLQAIDYLDIKNKLSKSSQSIYTDLRNIMPLFKDDQPKYKDIEKIKNHIVNTQLPLFKDANN